MEAHERIAAKLQQLVDWIHQLKVEQRRLEELVLRETARAAELEQQMLALKNQLDQGGTDRFKLRQYQDERKQLQRIVDQALARLAKIEESL